MAELEVGGTHHSRARAMLPRTRAARAHTTKRSQAALLRRTSKSKSNSNSSAAPVFEVFQVTTTIRVAARSLLPRTMHDEVLITMKRLYRPYPLSQTDPFPRKKPPACENFPARLAAPRCFSRASACFPAQRPAQRRAFPRNRRPTTPPSAPSSTPCAPTPGIDFR